MKDYDDSRLTIRPSVQAGPAQLPNSGQQGEPNPQGLANIRQLQSELDALIAQEKDIRARARAEGMPASVPDSLRQQINAKSMSLAAELKGDQIIRRRAAEQVEQNEDDSLTRVYEADFETAVNREVRQHGISRERAMDIVNQKLQLFGADKMLPQYARVMRRLQNQ